MAKSKRSSRRVRRQETEKPVQSPVVSAPQAEAPIERKAASAAPAVARKTTVDFSKDYYYVYAELRQIFLVTAVMFAAMVGISFFI
ncbi:MAG: hypothetical protein KDJ52_01445 [Anaerolineae bacterium]|nr:hypothetical protein [Anaerolineae bacterium]